MIKFSKYWSKLDGTVFTTIRKMSEFKEPGQRHLIKTPRNDFYAKIIGYHPISRDDITEILAQYDADMGLDDLLSMLKGWYGDHDDFVLITLLRSE